MSVREYVGARYVPLFAEPLTWDATRTYEPLTVVLYQGNSYTSRQSVPANIDITNTTYWAQTGNYNAQVEQYRQEVLAFNGRITQNTNDIAAEETARQNAIAAVEGIIPASNFDSTNTVKKYIDDLVSEIDSDIGTIESNIGTIESNITSLGKKRMVVLGDSWVATGAEVPTTVPYCWPEYLKKYLGCTDIDLFGRAGATIYGTSSTARSSLKLQVDAAIAGIDNPSEVKYVFIMMMINDCQSGHTFQEVTNALLAQVDRLTQEFPLATVYFVPNVFFDYNIWTSSLYTTYMSSITVNEASHQFVFIPQVAQMMLNFGQSCYRPNDDSSYTAGGGTYHPNKSGNEKIAQVIAHSILGSKIIYPIVFTALNGAVITWQHCYTDFDNCYINMQVKLPVHRQLEFLDFAETKWDNYARVLDISAESGSGYVLPLGSIGAANNYQTIVDKKLSVYVNTASNAVGKLNAFYAPTDAQLEFTLNGVSPLTFIR